MNWHFASRSSLRATSKAKPPPVQLQGADISATLWLLFVRRDAAQLPAVRDLIVSAAGNADLSFFTRSFFLPGEDVRLQQRIFESFRAEELLDLYEHVPVPNAARLDCLIKLKAEFFRRSAELGCGAVEVIHTVSRRMKGANNHGCTPNPKELAVKAPAT
jgi:hypothetical protein